MPVPFQNNDGTIDYHVYQGLTIRQELASRFLQAMMSNPDYTSYDPTEKVELSIAYADNFIQKFNQ